MARLILELLGFLARQFSLYQDAQKREEAQQALAERDDHYETVRNDPAAELRRLGLLDTPEPVRNRKQSTSGTADSAVPGETPGVRPGGPGRG